jgi:hypothetical protein
VPWHLRSPENCYRKSAKNGKSRIRKAFNPVQGPKDVGIAPEIILARSNTENMAAALISDRPPDAFREKSKLLVWRLLACPAGPPINLRSAVAHQSLFLF